MSNCCRVTDSAFLNWRRVSRTILALIAMAIVATAAPAISTAQSFQALGVLPGDSSSQALGVNVDGSVVVGSSFNSTNSQAFRWTKGTGMVGLGIPPGYQSSQALGVSADGSVVVGYSSSGNTISQAFRWTASTGFVGLGALPGYDASRATAVSADGLTVVGYSYTSNTSDAQAFRWTASSGMVALGFLPGAASSSAYGVNADGTIVVGDSGFQPFRWVAGIGMGGLGKLSGDFSSHASGVSADGMVVVGSSTNGPAFRGRTFRWTPSTGIVEIVISGGNLTAKAANADGSVIVLDCVTSFAFRCTEDGFRWTTTAGAEPIHALFAANGLDVANWTLDPQSVSADGTAIIGNGGSPNNPGSSWLAVIPVSAHLPILQVTPASDIALSGIQGGPFVPSSFTYSISALTGSVNYSISGVPSWLTASATSGTATTSGSTITFAPNANANALPVGIQTATITFTNKDTSVGTQTRTATAIVTKAPPTTIFAAVAPNARTTTLGGPVTAFASIVNAGSNPAVACSIALPNGVPATIFYQTTDPTTNSPTGIGNTVVNIAAGTVQTFYFAVTPTQVTSQDIRLVFSCGNTSPAPVFQGLNTFLLTATSSPVADMLSIAETLSRDGNMVIPGSTGTGLIATASINIQAPATVTFMPTDTPFGQLPRNLPVALSICQTDLSTGACVNPTSPGPSSTVTVANNETVFFSVFAKGQGTSIPYDPGNTRIFIIGTQGSTPVGEASAAVKMQ